MRKLISIALITLMIGGCSCDKKEEPPPSSAEQIREGLKDIQTEMNNQKKELKLKNAPKKATKTTKAKK